MCGRVGTAPAHVCVSVNLWLPACDCQYVNVCVSLDDSGVKCVNIWIGMQAEELPESWEVRKSVCGGGLWIIFNMGDVCKGPR